MLSLNMVSALRGGLPRLLGLLFAEQGASVVPFIGLGIFTIMSALGASIDMSRAQLVQARMSSALDNAGLAAAATANSININSEANKYFNANFPSGYMGTTTSALVISANGDNSVLNLSISGTVPTTIMKVVGINTISISAATEVTRGNKGLEVVLVMDNTGSMTQSAGGGTSKITAAKNAANSLVDILFGDKSSVPNLWIGLVPFSQAVNIGTGRGSWTSAGTYDWGTTSWGGCIESRSNGTLTPRYDITDDTPATRSFAKYYYPDDANNDWKTTTTRNGVTTTTYSINSSKGPNIYCPQPVTPMTASKNTITNSINAMTTGGNTHIDLGLAWGWRMLSPKWRGLWGGEMNSNQLPLDYNAPLMNKAIILMTDGDNTVMNGYYSAYGYPSAGQLGSNACMSDDCTNGENALDSRTTAVCNNIKANNSNVIIYTIALGTSIGTDAKNMLLGCASKPEYYFDSPSTSDLDGVFSQIGDSLANLRISK